MCQGDTSLLTMKWGRLQAVPLANAKSPHQCVDWTRLYAWAKDHSVDASQLELLMHPKFGESAWCPVMMDRRVFDAHQILCYVINRGGIMLIDSISAPRSTSEAHANSILFYYRLRSFGFPRFENGRSRR